MRGETLTGLARRNGLSESFLRMTLQRPSYRGEQIIARFLGIKPHEIWPDRYLATGKPAYRAKRPIRPLRRVA